MPDLGGNQMASDCIGHSRSAKTWRASGNTCPAHQALQDTQHWQIADKVQETHEEIISLACYHVLPKYVVAGLADGAHMSCCAQSCAGQQELVSALCERRREDVNEAIDADRLLWQYLGVCCSKPAGAAG